MLLQVVDELLHDSVNLLVAHCLLAVLQDEVHSIRLLAFRQILALVNVEEFDCLEQFLLSLVGDSLNLSKWNVTIEQQGKVATYGWELANLSVSDVLLLYDAHDLVPTNVGEIHRSVDVESFCELARYDAHLCEDFSATILDAETLTVNVALALAEDKHSEWNSQSCEDIYDVSLEFGK